MAERLADVASQPTNRTSVPEVNEAGGKLAFAGRLQRRNAATLNMLITELGASRYLEAP